MVRRFSVLCDDSLARRVDSLAREYDLSTEEAVRQLITVGLNNIEDDVTLRS